MDLGHLRSLVVETFEEWRDDDAVQWAAALSYYAALAAAPLLILLLAVAVLAFDEQTARRELLARVGRWAGPHGAEVAAAILRSDRAEGVRASVTGALLLVVGATGVFAQLQKALNRVWNVKPEEAGVRRLLASRLLAFGLVLGIGALLVASLAVRAVVSGLPAPGGVVRVVEPALSVGVFALVLAAVYKVLPDVVIHWKDVWIGAASTAALLVVGQVVIGLYLGHSTVGSAYGAAGSLVALLVWMYYSANVFFVGAELTQVWARRSGRRIEPQDGARWINPEEPSR